MRTGVQIPSIYSKKLDVTKYTFSVTALLLSNEDRRIWHLLSGQVAEKHGELHINERTFLREVILERSRTQCAHLVYEHVNWPVQLHTHVCILHVYTHRHTCK